MAPPPPTALALSGITVSFSGLRVLQDVSLQVPAGKVMGLIGPNGAGKTTLFNVVCGLVTPDAGRIAVAGRTVRPRPQWLAGAGIARTLQGVGLFDGLTVEENVMVGAQYTCKDERDARARAHAVLEELGLRAYQRESARGLPHAIGKRVALARALALDPRLLLLDEPAGGLAADEIDDLASSVARLRGQGRTVLLVEHHMDFVLRVCDSIAVLDVGRVIAIGSPDEIRADSAVAQAYLGLAA